MIQEIQKSSSEDSGSTKSKKRLQYKRMSEEKKRDLIFRVMYLNENVRTVCHELGFNFSTGRNLVQHYKKTGEYAAQEKSYKSVTLFDQGKAGNTKDTEGKLLKCPLGLVFLADDKIQLVTSRIYGPEEELALMEAHKGLMRRGGI